MQQTEHYQLNQWERTDRIQMEDFNNNNLKIEAALEGVTALCNCQVYVLPYTGTGEKGPVTHTFPHRPIFAAILRSGGDTWVFGARGLSTISGHSAINSYVSTPITWGERSITIGNTNYDAFLCCNSADKQYCIAALLDAAN